jgi:mono/diheme cytochrome c family protein
MTFRIAAALAVAALTGAGLWANQGGADQGGQTPFPQISAFWGQVSAANVPKTDTQQNALVDEYCATCHNTALKSGDLVLQGFNVASPLLSAELVERLIRKVRSGQMPPAGADRPGDAVMTAFVEALEARADAMTARAPDPGWRPFQRLNRAEYARVITDLLAVDIDPAAILPPDTTSGGFDNIADVQSVSPALISAYLRGAASVSRAAVGTAGKITPSRRRLFICSPHAKVDEAACADRIIRRLVVTAYRGAADDIDIADALRFYQRGRQSGSFENGIRLALQSILVSPKFLFRLEPVTASGVLTDVALASRLSFFLWSRGPDDVLMAAAARGELHTAQQLSAQALRMLADPRAESMSMRFAAQWLRLQDLGKVDVDAKLFPKFDAALAAAMRRETELTFADLIRRDASVTELITSSRSFVNDRLAAHYGIPGIRGPEFRPVTLPENRRGLLGQGSVLTLTSLGTRTSPVLRGKWVLDVLLGTPPPPPPPNVPALDDSTKPEKNGVPLSTLQRVEEHRQNPSCSGCHRVIDPPGMALENFDATGAWRAQDNGVDIDAIADLYDGRRMAGPGGLRDALLSHQDLIVRNFTQQLMTYALGRRLTYRDMPAVRAIVRSAGANGNRMSAFITGVVASDTFRMSRVKKES